MPLMLMIRPVPSVGMPGKQRLDHPQHADRLDVHVVDPVGIRPGDLTLLPFDGSAGVVDEDVNGLEFGGRAVGGSFDGRRLPHIGGNGHHTDASGRADLGGRTFEILDAAREQHEVDPFVGEPTRDRLADAFAGTGDERRATFES